MKKQIIVLLFILSNIAGVTYSQELVGSKITIKDAWDNVFRSVDQGRNYELIGTYQGWNKDAIYIAGYNYQNNPSYYSTKYVSFGGSGVERMWVDLLSGNVGIGTTSPSEKLEIGGNLRINNGENCTILPTGHSLTFGGKQDYAHVSYIFRPSWGTPSPTYSNLQLQNATNTGTFTTAVMFTTDGGNSYINSGNLGIGTTNPDEKLTVNGVIHAKEVKVDLSGPLADFVFKPNYKLMSLPQVEQFVKANNHLPQMPSAEEVAKNGLSMGEMQNKLLQKVEELTLYVIEQQKEINELKKRK